MSYRDPYAEQYGAGAGSRHQTQPPQQYPADSAPDYNNPYNHPHQTYDQGGAGYDNYNQGAGYRDEYTQRYDDYEPDYGVGGAQRYPPPQREPSQRTSMTRAKSVAQSTNLSVIPKRKEGSAFDAGEFTPVPQKRTAGALKSYRYNHQGNLWTKGGRGRCVGRFCCLLSLALWIRPPGVQIGDVQPVSQGGSVFQLQQDGININLGINISVNNPNYFAVNFKQIKAEIFYPINDTAIGGGTSNNVVFESHSQKNFPFLFAIEYKTSSDPSSKILLDLAQKCGVIGTKSDISVSYKITVGIRILFITVSPVVSNKVSFPCPVDPEALKALMGGVGGLSGLVGGTGSTTG
ncbi:hypothetical protein BDQ12DRAFT_732057 [Crucibulum laeve]|uniref:Late embryogenesis abundant protein LEA-2 subgroup domain-containing protein n=1 Tax=Crucibulum laeve TaxID=68775 RepID=A0A5C3MAA5_9AGAR|nr:hypothetical protein BDQ12DRAFT_732057 [Crucibulum laeve]